MCGQYLYCYFGAAKEKGWLSHPLAFVIRAAAQYYYNTFSLKAQRILRERKIVLLDVIQNRPTFFFDLIEVDAKVECQDLFDRFHHWNWFPTIIAIFLPRAKNVSTIEDVVQEIANDLAFSLHGRHFIKLGRFKLLLLLLCHRFDSPLEPEIQ